MHGKLIDQFITRIGALAVLTMFTIQTIITILSI